MLRMKYPRSRLKSAGQCGECRQHPGNMEDRGRVALTRSDGSTVEFLQWTCDKCGLTKLFDLEVPRSTPWTESGPGSVEEDPIDP